MHRWLVALTWLTGTASAESLRGTVLEKADNTPVAGATIIASPILKGEVLAEISDENGAFSFRQMPRGSYDITVYYGDGTTTAAKALLVDGDLVFAPIVVEDPGFSIGCVFWDYPPPEMTSYPRLGFNARRSLHPISRDRTHRAWIAPAAAADPALAVTTLEGGTLLARSPGIPLAFVGEVSTETARIPISTPSGIGGAAGVSLRSGSNDPAGDATLVLGLDGREPSEGTEMFLAGPIIKDKFWLAGGLVAARDVRDTLSADSMLRADYMPTSDHTISLLGLAHAASTDDRASWSAAKWKARLFDYKLGIETIATAQTFTQPVDLASSSLALATRSTIPSPDGELISRYGAQTSAELRVKALGRHTLYAGLGGGAGTRGDLEHADASGFVGDEYFPRPNVTLTAGTRWEARRFDDQHTTATLPRASIMWDPTKEGRTDLFVAYQRISRLDDGLPGDWRALDQLTADEVSTGFAIADTKLPIMVGIAGRARYVGDDRRLGLESWARIERAKTTISAQLTSLGKVGTLLAQHKWINRKQTALIMAASLRATPDRTDGGAAMTLRRKLTDEHGDDRALDLTLEGHDGPDGPGSRLLLGMSW